jgi:catechol 2,3-dioxygenase-like lactoylglutathione lyase family enzyme
VAGARNVFMQVGDGLVHVYDQPPNHRGPVNHLGIRVDDLDSAVIALASAGFEPRPVKSDGSLRYSMVEGPDGILFELFEVKPGSLEPALSRYFGVDEG